MELLEQIDMIVVDVSGSMKSKSGIDPDMTREDLSKLVFHTMVDKMLCLEMSNIVGLLAFGGQLTTIPFTTTYETFHTELGRLDANQGCTKLYDAIQLAIKHLLEFKSTHKDQCAESCLMRIFVLTDGEDNASTSKPWEVAVQLQKEHITLDAFPMGSYNPTLHTLCASTNGFCVDVTSVIQGVELFDRESLTRLKFRSDQPLSASAVNAIDIATANDFAAFLAQIGKSGVKRAVETGASTVTIAAVQAKVTTAVTVEAAATSNSQSVRRLLKEFCEMQQSPFHPYVCGTMSNWKVILPGAADSPFAKGFFVVSVTFPGNYPFAPPRVRFLQSIFHPNISKDGNLCLPILEGGWSPALTIHKVFLELQNLLRQPDVGNPLNSLAATMYNGDRADYIVAAEKCAMENASLEDIKARFNLTDDDAMTIPNEESAPPTAAAPAPQ